MTTNNNWPAGSLSSGWWINQDRRLALYIRDSFTCYACLRDLTQSPTKDLTLDHFIPRSNTHKPDNRNQNLLLCCRTCNDRRGTLSVFTAFGPEVDARARYRLHLPVPLELARSFLVPPGQSGLHPRHYRAHGPVWQEIVRTTMAVVRGTRSRPHDYVPAHLLPGESVRVAVTHTQ